MSARLSLLADVFIREARASVRCPPQLESCPTLVLGSYKQGSRCCGQPSPLGTTCACVSWRSRSTQNPLLLLPPKRGPCFREVKYSAVLSGGLFSGVSFHQRTRPCARSPVISVLGLLKYCYRWGGFNLGMQSGAVLWGNA